MTDECVFIGLRQSEVETRWELTRLLLLDYNSMYAGERWIVNRYSSFHSQRLLHRHIVIPALGTCICRDFLNNPEWQLWVMCFWCPYTQLGSIKEHELAWWSTKWPVLLKATALKVNLDTSHCGIAICASGNENCVWWQCSFAMVMDDCMVSHIYPFIPRCVLFSSLQKVI